MEKSSILVKVGNRSIRLTGQSKMKDPDKEMPDSAYDAETVIGFDEEDPFARIHTASIMVCKRLKKAGLTPNPAETQTINGVESDWVFIVPKQHISIKEAKEKCYIAGKPRKKDQIKKK